MDNVSLVADHSILHRIIKDSLIAFPNDAHHQVLQYLTDAGLDEPSALKFRQAWSKVVLGAQAFGRASKQKVDPVLFSTDLIRELSYSDENVLKIINAAESCLKLDHHRNTLLASAKTKVKTEDIRNPRDGIASLDAINYLGSDLAKTLASIFANSANNASAMKQEEDIKQENGQVSLFESIGLFRKSLRGTRIAWSNSILPPAAGAYSPMDARAHGFPDYMRGRLDMQLRSDRHDLNVYMTTDELMGVVVSNKQAIHQERAWSAYLSTNELLSSQGLNIFPLPVGILRESANLATTFVFESAAGAELLCGLQGPALSTYLRRMPLVPHRWCAQLAAAYHALLGCSGSLMKPIEFEKDVYIRENGLLLIGHVVFDSVAPRSKPAAQFQHYAHSFLRLACDVLEKCLCLSRQEPVALIADSSRQFDAAGEVVAVDASNDEDEEEEVRGAVSTRQGEAEGEGEGDCVLSVVVGSTLEILLLGHDCTTFVIENAEHEKSAGPPKASSHAGHQHQHQHVSRSISSAVSASAASLSTLAINIAASKGSYSDYASVDAKIVPRKASKGLQHASAMPGSGSCSLSLCTLRPGVLSLYVSAVVLEEQHAAGGSAARSRPDHADHAGARYRRKGRRIQVVIVPSYPVESVLLLDLVGHLQECRTWGDPSILLHSQLFLRPQQLVDHHHAATAPPAPFAAPLSPKSESATEPSSRKPIDVSAKDVQKSWQDIRRIIANYGSHHLPPTNTHTAATT
jgi:hypothetical protein